MINNRQNGRRRGRGGNNGGGNGQRSGNPGRPDSGNRIDSRARGNANQLYEKYKNLARDAQMSGDRVNIEYYLQFADHYFRVLNETRMRFEEQNPNAAPQRRIQPVDSFDDFDGDDDDGDEGEPIRAGEQGGQDNRDQQRGGTQDGQRQGNQRDAGRQQGPRDGQPRYDQPRYEGRRDEPRFDDGRGGARRNGYANEGSDVDGERDHGNGNGNGQRGFEQPRDQQARDQQARDRQPRDQQPEQDRSSDRYAVTGSPIANDRGAESPDGAEPSPVEPRRRGRPRRVAQDVAPVADAAEAPAAFDADRLPPSLSLATGRDASEEAADDQEAPRPRRRRVRATNGDASPLG